MLIKTTLRQDIIALSYFINLWDLKCLFHTFSRNYQKRQEVRNHRIFKQHEDQSGWRLIVLISIGAKRWQYFLISPAISGILPEKDLFLLFLLHFNTIKDWDYLMCHIWIYPLKSRVKLYWNSSDLYIYQPPLHSVCRSAYHVLKAFTIKITRRSLIKMWSHDSYGCHGNSG